MTPHGLRCPHCLTTSTKYQTIDVRPAISHVRRRRRCLHCGASFRTRECVDLEDFGVCVARRYDPLLTSTGDNARCA